MKAVNWFMKQDLMTKVVIVIAVLVAIWLISVAVRKIRVELKKDNAQKAFNSGEYNASGTTPSGTPYTFNAATVAAEVYDAFYDNDWFGWTEDEEKAITALRNVPREFIPMVADAYYKLYDHVLQQDCTTYLEDDYSRVADLFQ